MPDNARIFTTAAILENEKVLESGSTDIPMYARTQRKEWVDNYWKDIDQAGGRRRIFPVEYAQLDALFENSSDIALIVYEIDDPSKVSVKWVPFSRQKPPRIRKNSRCFVLSKQNYSGDIGIIDVRESSYFIRGLKMVKPDKNNPATIFLLALIGKDNAGNYALFLQNATATFLEKDPGGGFDTAPGGEGASSQKIPM